MKPPDPKTEATTSTILMRAADILREKGWVQKCLENELGVCVHGAIFMARREVEGVSEATYNMGDVFGMTIGDPEYHFAAYLLKVYQQYTVQAGCTTSWNDCRGRTKDEVITALEGAALWQRE